MINSTPFTSLAGTTWVEINVGTEDNFTIDLVDMGTIDYEFDLIPSDQEIQSIGGMPGATSIVVDDITSTRESLYDYLVDTLGNYNGLFSREVPKAKVTFYLQEPDNVTRYEFPFEFTVADLGIDDRSKKTTIGLSPRTVNLTVDEWANEAVASGIPSRMSYESQGTFFINSWPSGDFIYNVVERLDTNANTIYISGDLGATASLPNPIYVFERLTDIVNSPTNIFVDDYSTLMFVQNVQMDFASENSVFSKVRTFAGMEGAIFGSAFNHNFYINRLTNSINIDIGIDDVSELKFQQHNRDINAVIISFSNTNKIDDNTNIADGLPRITNAIGGVPAWQTGSRLLSTTFTGFYPQLNRGVYDVTDNYVSGDDDSLFAINDILLARFASGVYARPTGAAVSDTSLYKAEFDILGATKIKPWEVIKFDSTVPLRYQGKHFRPTSLSYDLKADKVKVTAYEIDTFPIPTPPDPPDPPQEFCFGSENIYTFYEDSSMLTVTVSNTSDLFAYGESSNYVTQYDLTTNTVVQNIEMPSTFYGTFLFFDDADRYLYVMSNQEKHVRIINVANTGEQTIINTFNDGSDLFAAFVEDKTRRKLYVGLDTVAANPPIMTIDLATRTRGTNVDYRTNTALAGTPEGLAIDVTRNIIVAADQGSTAGRGVYMLNLEDNSKQKLNVPSVSQNRFVHAAYSENSSAFYVFGDGTDTNVHSITSPSANIALVGSVPVYDLPMTILTNPIDGQIYFVTYPSDGFYPPETINVPLSDTYNVAVLNPLTNTFSLYTSLGADGEGRQMVVDSNTAKMYYGSAQTVPTAIFEFCMQPEE